MTYLDLTITKKAPLMELFNFITAKKIILSLLTASFSSKLHFQ